MKHPSTARFAIRPFAILLAALLLFASAASALAAPVASLPDITPGSGVIEVLGRFLPARDTSGGTGINISDVIIHGLDEPASHAPLDPNATVTAQVEENGTSVSWEIPVLWVDASGNIVTRSRRDCAPILAFFVPEGYIFDGRIVDLSFSVKALIGQGEEILYFDDKQTGICYIFGEKLVHLFSDVKPNVNPVVDPVNPVVDPVNPVNPVKPVDPVNPVDPAAPGKPAEDVARLQPVLTAPAAPGASPLNVSAGSGGIEVFDGKLPHKRSNECIWLIDVTITGIDDHNLSGYLDPNATVTAKTKEGGTSVSWEIPIWWVDASGNTVTRPTRRDCAPILAFFMPEEYGYYGNIAMDDTVRKLVAGEGGTILYFVDEHTGICYIFGEKLAFLFSFDRPNVNPNVNPVNPAEEEIIPQPVPAGPGAPAPGDERTPMEIFADKYKGDYRNIDWAAEEVNLGGDLLAADWSELIGLIGYNNLLKVEFESGLEAFYNAKFENEWQFYSDFVDLFAEASTDFLLEHWERASDAPESLTGYVPENDSEMVFGLYDHEELEDLLDTLVNRIQPRAVQLLMDRIPAFRDAGPDAFSKATAFLLYYSMDDMTGLVTASYERGTEIGYQMALSLENIPSEYDREDELEHIDPNDLGDLFLSTVVHENMHLIMYDFNRPLMDGYNGVPVAWDEAYNATYSIPGYGDLTAAERQALLDAAMAPKWFKEGIATAMGGYYDSYTEYYHASARETPDGYVYDPDRVQETFADWYGSLDSAGAGSRSEYIYGSLAVIYLGEMALRHEGDTAVVRDEGGAVTSIDSEALRSGISKLLQDTHDGTTLDQVISEISGGVFMDTQDFGRRFIAGDENGPDAPSAQFTADLLNYLEQVSVEQGSPVNGSVLVDFTESIYDRLKDDDAPESELYGFVGLDGYVRSDVSAADAARQSGKSEFDLNAYRTEQAGNNVGMQLRDVDRDNIAANYSVPAPEAAAADGGAQEAR